MAGIIVALASNSQELQTLIALIEHYANTENNKIHPVKSEIVPFNIKSRELNNTIESNRFTIHDSKIPIRNETTPRNQKEPSIHLTHNRGQDNPCTSLWKLASMVPTASQWVLYTVLILRI